MCVALLCFCSFRPYFSVYLKTSDVDFLGYYSVFAGPARKVMYVLCGFAWTLSSWRFSLERLDGDRHAHFISRYHLPNSSAAVWLRNLLCALLFGLAFLLGLMMVPLEDYMESQWQANRGWFVLGAGQQLPQHFTTRIGAWYAMAMARLVFVSLAWLCIVQRFGAAEHSFLQLHQEKYERRNMLQPGTLTNAPPPPLSRTRGEFTARSSRVSSSQHLGATGNGGALRMDSTQGGTLMMVPPRR